MDSSQSKYCAVCYFVTIIDLIQAAIKEFKRKLKQFNWVGHAGVQTGWILAESE